MEALDITTILKDTDLITLGITACILLITLCLFIFLIVRFVKKSKAKKIAPVLEVQNLLVAPLGKGVQIKLQNQGERAIITELKVIDRQNIEITKGYTNYEIDNSKVYSIFCEANGQARADSGFDLEIKYTDQTGNQYKQRFHIEKDKNRTDKPKLTNYA